MAEHDADREPDERDASPGDEQGPSFDEAAAWEAIVAGYGDEPPDPPGAKPFKSIEDLALLEPETNDTDGDSDTKSAKRPKGAKSAKDGQDTEDKDTKDSKNVESSADSVDSAGSAGSAAEDEPAAGKPLGSSVAFAPGLAGPRDYTTPEPVEEDFDEDDEGHFVPPEPPPLPAADTTAKFAWLAVIGGPILLLLAVLLGWDMTWWLATVGIGGFLGGFATLVARMGGDEDEDEDDPGRGAVV
ncbi:hypothetical protein [Streptomyces sp. NPDC050704]|uniref:hypothetical protein n=1 Tax=Streptomyces sp. NPDC050704 TaxID=3157219 RepID=UPI0034297791